MICVDHIEELHLLELIRDVPNHDGCPGFLLVHDSVEVNVITDSFMTFFFFFGCLSFELGFLRFLFLLGQITLTCEGLRMALLSCIKNFLRKL